jgi:hypothetical protein
LRDTLDKALHPEFDARDVNGTRNKWEVHHRYQQHPEVARWLYEMKGGFKVHDVENLRAVPNFIHDEIGNRQREFWDAKMKALGVTSIGEVIANTAKPKKLLEEYEALVAGLDEVYEPYWMEPGSGQPQLRSLLDNLEVRNTRQLFGSTARRAFDFGELKRATRLKRLTKIGFGLLAMVPALSPVAEAANWANFSQDQLDAYEKLLETYRRAMESSEYNNGIPAARNLEDVQRDLGAFLEAMDVDATLRRTISDQLQVYINLIR